MQALKQQLPSAKWYVHEACVNPAIGSAARKVAGKNAIIAYDLSKADVVVSLDADFLDNGPDGIAQFEGSSRRGGCGRRQQAQPLLCDRILADGERFDCGSSVPGQGSSSGRSDRVSIGERGGVSGASAQGRRRDWLSAVAQDLTECEGTLGGDSGRVPARACAPGRARHQRGAGQHRADGDPARRRRAGGTHTLRRTGQRI